MRLLRTTLAITLIQATILLGLWGGAVVAGLIVRSTKAGSTTSFATSNSLGNTLAVADLDSDLDALYSTINGSIESSNIAADTIVAADIAPDAIEASELANNSVASANIIDGTIVPADLNSSARATAQTVAVGSVATTTTETTVGTLGSLTTVGGPVLLGGSSSLIWFRATGSAIGTIRFRWYRDATPILTVDSDITASTDQNPIAIPPYVETPAAGSYVYKLTVQTTDATINIGTSASNRGTLYAVTFP